LFLPSVFGKNWNLNRPIGCVFHGMVADELPHPQQQLPLPTNDLEAQPGGGWPWPDLSLALGPDEANHAASAPMGSQGSFIVQLYKIRGNSIEFVLPFI